MPNIKIKGPARINPDGTAGAALWTAKGKLIKQDDQYSFRNLFLDRNPRVFNPLGTPYQMLLPGTVAARCMLSQIDLVLNGDTYQWKPADLTVTLLLAAASKDWFPYDDTKTFDTPEMTLVAGEIPLPSPPGPTDWAGHFPVISGARNLSVHATGLSFDGNASFAWDDTPVSEPARFNVMLPFGSDESAFRISLDRGGLTEPAKQSLRSSFDHLQRLLQPQLGPAWAAIELASKSDVPQFYWQYSAKGVWDFGLERGEVSVILADRNPGDADRNVATLLPPVRIRKTGQNDLTLTINDYQDQNDDGSQWKYQWDKTSESVAITGIVAGFDPVAAAAFLRGLYRLEAPQPNAEASSTNPMLLWGFQPLEDGYAQLPFFNLNEQILFDIFPVQSSSPPATAPSLIAGALSYSNDLSGEPAGVPAGEHPWSATLLNADSVTGQWEFVRNPDTHGLALASAKLHLFNPQLVLNGMLWLATAPPTAADLLPAPDNWLAGLHQIALSTPRLDDVLQPPFSFRFSSIGFKRKPPSTDPESRAVQLTGTTFSWQVNPSKLKNNAHPPVAVTILEGLLSSGKQLFNRDRLWQSSALLWRSHPALPVVQSLPLTQNQSPANAPSPSRQFAPFDLPFQQQQPDGWIFSASDNAAAAWPRYVGAQLHPSQDWTGLVPGKNPYPCVIPMAALSQPGLAFDPLLPTLITTEVGFLPAQYRFGLPYLDEVYALSEVPKEHQGDPLKRPDGGALPRETFRDYWRALSEKSYLASADSDDLLSSDGAQTVAKNLIEPFSWQVQASLADAAYPGTLAIRGGTVPLDLSGDPALRGIHGYFRSDGNGFISLVPPDPTALQVVAGSLAAEGTSGQLRDQRGLLRSATVIAGNTSTLFTPVESKAHPGLAICTTLSAIGLPPGWNFWFRDLPVSPSGNTRIFDRSATRSSAARGVNDPAAQSTHRVELTAYEWRLGLPDKTKLKLYGLQFVPLALERAEFDTGGNLTKLIVSGRLLPPWVDDPKVESARANAVRLQWEGAPLKLTSITPESRDSDGQDVPPLASEHAGEWLLSNGEDSPRLLWDDVALGDNSVVLNATTLGLLDFIFWGQRWLLEVGRIVVSEGGKLSIGIACPNQSGSAAQMSQVNLSINLAAASPKASLTAMLLYQWGKPDELVIEAVETVLIFGESDAAGQPVQVFLSKYRNGKYEHFLELDNVLPAVNASTVGAFQASFSGIKTPDATLFQLLPGMHLAKQDALTGYVAVAFGVNGISSDRPSPPLNATAAFAELLISADWGDFLQEPGQLKARIYGSSAGSLRCSYTAASSLNDPRNTTWQSRLLLNGFIEIKNLISWPVQQGDPSTFVIPVASAGASLNHTRHTIRILLNQHEPVAKLLRDGPGQCLFGFADSCGWQFLAVTEHQCVDVVADAIANDRRWTTVQEVRLLTPALFIGFLTEARDQYYYTVQPSTLQGIANARSLEDTDASYLHKKLRDALIADNPAVTLRDALIVEASATHWIKAQAEGPGRFSTLQYLPGINQQGTLSVLADFDVSPTDITPPWRLLSIPFLGRLQDQSRDGLDAASAPPDSALQVDPILTLQRNPGSLIEQFLASWVDSRALNIPVGQFDRAGQRQWSRLDPASLAESWYRLQTPAPEQQIDGLASVLAAKAVDSPGRLSRPATLQQSYESWRESLPPGQPAGNPFLSAANTRILWRRDSLFTLHGDIPGAAGDHRLYIAGALLASSGLSAATAETRRFPSATLVPPVFQIDSHYNPEPVTLSVSPYVGLSLQRLTREPGPPSLVYGDLICLDPSGTKLQIVATQIWQGDQTGNDAGMREWAKQTRDRLATGSKVGILRLRAIQPARTDDLTQPEVATVEYRFDILTCPPPDSVAQLAHPLRAALARIHYEEGQLSDQIAPGNLVDFEAAPPQVRGVQPIYESHRPLAANQPVPTDPDDEVWPWGLSAVRFHVQATEGVDPTDSTKMQPFGVPGDGTFIWWQATSHFVQFASGTEQAVPALPWLFRATAITSMLSASPRAPLPPIQTGDYSPVLPGAWDLIVTGARPGAPFVFRHHLIRQSRDFKSAVASGSVPVQHRMPRPLAIPPTRKHVGPNPLLASPMPPALDGRNFALLTWPSYFTPDLSVAATSQPCDTAFLAVDGTSPAGLNITLVSPWESAQVGQPDPYFDNATIPPGWKGVLRFNITDGETGNAPSGWSVRCSLEDDITILDASNGPVNPTIQTMFNFTGADLTAFMAGKQHGDAIRAIVQAENTSTSVKGYRQRLVFPLRVSLVGNLPSPMVPVFALFEDPEYNRRLISDTVRAQGVLALATGAQWPVSLAVDRRQYNPTSHGYVVYSVSRPVPKPGDKPLPDLAIVISIVGKDGLPRALQSSLDPPKPGDKTICEFSIDGEGQPGETLMVQLVIPAKPNNTILVSLTADIVADPVVPAVEAAFALLRRHSIASKSFVACARFAWSPAASRIELLNPDDLLNRETVRRRAIFQWTDVVRKTRDYTYAVQKIMPGGSTHVPLEASFRIPKPAKGLIQPG